MREFKIENLTLSDLAYEKVKSVIVEGILKPGTKINQEKVAKELGISKIPLLQALTLLSKEGLVVKIPRKGFFVKEYSKKELEDIFEARAAFEMQGVFALIEYMDPQIEKKLKDFIKDFEVFYKHNEIEKYGELDEKFHHYLVEASKNNLIIKLNKTHNILLVCFTKGLVLDMKTSLKQHKEIIDYIFKRDALHAGLSMRNHIRTLKEEFVKSQ